MRVIFLLIVLLGTAHYSIGNEQKCESSMVPSISDKIWTYGQDSRERPSSKKVILVGGCFDVFHYGHLTFLMEAKKQGDYLVVALESDDAIQSYKRRKPVHNIQQRAHILASLLFVDEVVILPRLKGYDDYMKLVTTLHPDIIAVTEGDPQIENKRKQMASIGGTVNVVTSHVFGLSTTSIISRAKCDERAPS